MTGLLSRVGAYFLEAAEAPVSDARPPIAAPGAPSASAAVLGAPASVVAVAAACAGELRARAGAAAALICVWRPPDTAAPPADTEPDAPAARSPAGATTRGAGRVAARLVAQDLAATACGRLAWLALDPDPAIAAGQVRRCHRAIAVPLVLAVAGARPAELEPLLAELDICIAVLSRDIDPALREVTVATLPAARHAVVAPLPPGPPRWAAMAGLGRLRSLPEVPR